MHTLGELWVELDSLISSFRSGMLDVHGFRDSFSSKIEAINHILKPNMHMFDVYYVKYIENLIKDYSRIINLKEIPKEIVSSFEFNSEMETSYSPAPQTEQTDLFKSEIEDVLETKTLNVPANENKNQWYQARNNLLLYHHRHCQLIPISRPIPLPEQRRKPSQMKSILCLKRHFPPLTIMQLPPVKQWKEQPSYLKNKRALSLKTRKNP